MFQLKSYFHLNFSNTESTVSATHASPAREPVAGPSSATTSLQLQQTEPVAVGLPAESVSRHEEPVVEAAATVEPQTSSQPQEVESSSQTAPENEVRPTVESMSTPQKDGSPAAKRGKYKSYSVEEKKLIVEKARMNGIRQTAQAFKIAKSTVMDWMNADFSPIQSNKRGARSPGAGRKLLMGVENDDKILKWVLQQRDMHIPVSRAAIQEHARKECGIEGFKASDGWLRHFMRRHQLSLRCRTSMSQKLPADLEDKVSSFTKFVRELRIEDDFEDDFIVNMDETPVFFDIVPSKTVNQMGSKSVIVRTSGSDKRHITVMLAITASGKVLPTMIIFKGKRELKDIKAPPGCIVAVQEKAWVDERIMLRWVEECLIAYTKKDRTLLILDAFRCHIMDSVKKQIKRANAQLAVIPGGCTSVLQPLDVSVNKPFKGWLRAMWADYIREDCIRVEAARKAGDLTAKVDRPPSRSWLTGSVLQSRS